MNSIRNLKMTTYTLSLGALCVACTAVCSWISIPLPGAVPINLATFSVIITGCMLGPFHGAISILVYVLLGAVGLPVFHSFAGGLGVIIGPTGGYILGYILLAAVMGATRVKSFQRIGFRKLYIICFIIGEIILYVMGTIMYVNLTENPWSVALLTCVLPFIPGDIIKGILAYIIVVRLNRSLVRPEYAE